MHDRLPIRRARAFEEDGDPIPPRASQASRDRSGRWSRAESNRDGDPYEWRSRNYDRYEDPHRPEYRDRDYRDRD